MKRFVNAVDAVGRLRRRVDSAVPEDNVPGEALDGSSDCTAVAAALAMQDAIRGSTVSSEVTVFEHHAETFSRVRRYFGRSDDEYKHSLSEAPLRLVGERDAAGKSNAFFVFTGNGRYCVKSVDEFEAHMLMRIVAEYEQYVLANKKTLLPRFFGLYEVRLPRRAKSIWMLVQGNVLGGRSTIFQRFDLKGSTHGRRASSKEKSKGRSSVWKDLDFVEHGLSIRGVDDAAAREWESWVDSLQADARWLASHNLLDYSLLIGFGSCPRDELKQPLSHVDRLQLDWSSIGDLGTATRDTKADALVLYVGIVDCLMPYSLVKKCENIVCSMLVSADISCQAPDVYALRFTNFVTKLASAPGELQEYTAKRHLATQRPLGTLVAEFGRTDVVHICNKLSNVVILSGSLLAFYILRRQTFFAIGSKP